jgi:hypothetical protein
LNGEVELNSEREQHTAERHPDLLPAHRQRIIDTLAEPDQVRRSRRFSEARLFSRWFGSLRGGKFVVVVVVSDAGPRGRHWIITAYFTRKLSEGVVEWQRV